MLRATLIPYYHASMSTLQNSRDIMCILVATNVIQGSLECVSKLNKNKKTVEPWGLVLSYEKDYTCSCTLCSYQSMIIYYTYITNYSKFDTIQYILGNNYSLLDLYNYN
jgi:hypothetical protein